MAKRTPKMQTTTVVGRYGKPEKRRVLIDSEPMERETVKVERSKRHGRFAHRAERIAAAIAESDAAAVADKHPRPGWTNLGNVNHAESLNYANADGRYKITKIDSADRPKRNPMRGARRRKGVGGSTPEGLAGTPKVSDGYRESRANLNYETGRLVAAAEAKLQAGTVAGIGEMRLELREHALTIRHSNPAGAAYLQALHDSLKNAQYRVA